MTTQQTRTPNEILREIILLLSSAQITRAEAEQRLVDAGLQGNLVQAMATARERPTVRLQDGSLVPLSQYLFENDVVVDGTPVRAGGNHPTLGPIRANGLPAFPGRGFYNAETQSFSSRTGESAQAPVNIFDTTARTPTPTPTPPAPTGGGGIGGGANIQLPSLGEDFFDRFRRTGAFAQFQNRALGAFPGAALDPFISGAVNAAFPSLYGRFLINAATNGGNFDFGNFLGGSGGGGNFQQAASSIANPNPGGNLRQQAAIAFLRLPENQRAQFDAFTGNQVGSFPSFLRSTAQNVLDQQFNSILANQAANTRGFQFLPFLTGQGTGGFSF